MNTNGGGVRKREREGEGWRVERGAQHEKGSAVAQRKPIAKSFLPIFMLK